ncbi:MAG TPA: hypothetical protein VGE67_01225 [Haloferula sp.]
MKPIAETESSLLDHESLNGVLVVIPPIAKVLLIEAIYTFQPAHLVRASLAKAGIKRGERAVMIWLKAVRQWLGFPKHYPCVSSEVYRALVAQCRERNGVPAAEEIVAGWQPRRLPH